MYRHQAAQDDVVLNGDMTGQGCNIGHDDAVADAAVVGHVGIGHEQVVVADDRLGVSGDGAAVNGGKFADHVVVADPGPALFAPVFQILRRSTDRCLREYLVVLTDFGPVTDHGMRADSGSLADGDMFADDGVWADFYVCSQCWLLNLLLLLGGS